MSDKENNIIETFANESLTADIIGWEEQLIVIGKKLGAQYDFIPIPILTWKKIKKDFILIFYNESAKIFTNGKIENFIRKKALEILKDNLEIVIDLSRCFINKSSFEKKIVYNFWNKEESKRLCVNYSFSPPDLVFVSIQDVFENDKIKEKLKDTGIPLIGKIESYTCKNGKNVWHSTPKIPIFNGEREISGILGISRDITSLKQTQEELWQSEEKLQILINASTDIIFLINTQGIIIASNFKAAQLLGKISEEIINHCLFDLIPVKFSDHLKSYTNQVIHARKTLRYEDILNEKEIEVTLSPSTNLKSATNYVAVFIRDITNQKFVERNILELSQFKERVIDNSNIWISLIDKERNILLWNKAAERISGYTKEEVVGNHKIWQWQYPEKSYRKKIIGDIKKIFKKKLTYEDYVTKIKCKDGKEKLISRYVKCLFNERGEPIGILTLGRDITEQKQIEKALFKAKNELELRVKKRTKELAQMNEDLRKEVKARIKIEEKLKTSLMEKEVLLKEIHHRVKNNLQVISSLITLQSKSSGNKKISEMFENCRNRVKSISLIHEQLYLSDNLIKIDWNAYVKNLINNLFCSYGVESNSLSLNISIDNVDLGIDRGTSFGLILYELLSNSLKYGTLDNKKLEINIHLSKLPDDRLELIIGDNGNGLPLNINIQNPQTFGFQLVSMLCSQLGGNLELIGEKRNTFRIIFPLKKIIVRG